jgi:hypothetical protein
VREEKERVARLLTRAQGLAKLVGSDPALRAAIDLTATAADADAPVRAGGPGVLEGTPTNPSGE